MTTREIFELVRDIIGEHIILDINEKVTFTYRARNDRGYATAEFVLEGVDIEGYGLDFFTSIDFMSITKQVIDELSKKHYYDVDYFTPQLEYRNHEYVLIFKMRIH